MRGDTVRLADILERIGRIREATSAGRDEFLSSPVIQDAVVRNLEVIGEASRELSVALKGAHPEIAWKSIVGFRTLATHAYWSIDPKKLWPIVATLPDLRRKIAAIQAPE